MGSLTSRPSAPPQQQPVIITVPQPVYEYVPPANTYTPPPVTPPADNGDPATPPPAISEEAKSAARSEGLLNRNRGVLGTVLTGFRGLLNQSTTAARKTLLGE